MKAEMTMADGSTRALTLHQEGEALEIRERHGGRPDPWGSTPSPYRPWGWNADPPIPFLEAYAEVPGYMPLTGDIQGVWNQPNGRYSLVRHDQWKVPAKRNNVDLWPTTASYHRIFPSDTFYWRFVPSDDPFELRVLSRVTAAERAKALKVMDMDEARIARWPFLRDQILALYKSDASSLNPATPVGRRNVGWLLMPKNFAQRWWGYPYGGGEAGINHWYGFGTRSSAPAENLSNEHYNADGAWIAQGLRANDHVALTTGLYLLRYKLAYGLIQCDDTNCRAWGRWRNEKGDVARGTTGMAPSWAKEYDRSLAAASCLLPGDTWIKQGAQVRQTYLLNAGHEWQGNGGARNIGHFLENLHVWYVATGDARFKTKAESELAYALGKVGGLPYFPENIGSPTVSCGEGVLALVAARRWVIEECVLPAVRTKLDQMLAWYLANAWNPTTGRVGYFLDSSTTPATVTYSGHFQGVTWLALDLPTDVRAKIEGYMMSVYAGRSDWDATFAGEGAGLSKWFPELATYGALRQIGPVP